MRSWLNTADIESMKTALDRLAKAEQELDCAITLDSPLMRSSLKSTCQEAHAAIEKLLLFSAKADEITTIDLVLTLHVMPSTNDVQLSQSRSHVRHARPSVNR